MFDDFSNGLPNSVVRLWRDDGLLLRTGFVGNAEPFAGSTFSGPGFNGQFRYDPLITPYTLTPGVYRIAGNFGSSSGVSDGVVRDAVFSGGNSDFLTMLQPVFTNSVNAFPSSVFSGDTFGYIGPNFQYDVITSITVDPFSIGFTDVIENPAGSATLITNPVPDPLNVGELAVGNTGNGMLLLSSGGQIDVGDQLFVGRSGGSNGTLTMNGGTVNTGTNPGAADPDLEIGNDGTGTFTQTGGTTNVGDDLILGHNATGDGTLDLQGGTVNVNNSTTSVGTLGKGRVFVSGTAQLNALGGGGTVIGTQLIADGGVTIDGGTLDTLAMEVARFGTGTLTIANGGQVDVRNELVVGTNSTGNGTVTMNGGTLSTGTAASPNDPDLEIGFFGTGTFTQTGGTTTVADELILGHELSGTGTLDLQGGTVNVSADAFVGFRGEGTLKVSGTGQLNVGPTSGTGNLIVGEDGIGTLSIADDASVAVANPMIVGLNAGSSGTVTMTGGTLNAAGLDIAQNGTATFDQSGGTVTVTNNVFMGKVSGGKGTLDMTDGTMNVGGFLTIGNHDSPTTNAVTVSGTNTLLDVTGVIDVGNHGIGTLTMNDGGQPGNGGQVEVGGMKIATSPTGNGTLDISAGTLTSHGDLDVGWTGTATLNQTGGTINVANQMALGNLFVASEGTVTMNGGTLNVGTDSGAASDDRQLLIGLNGTGIFTQTAGTTTVGSDVVIGRGPSSNGTLSVSGSGQMDIAAGLWVGYTNGGTLNITNGGMVSSDFSSIGRDAGSIGAITVDGVGSTWTNAANFNVGSSGDGTLEIKNGGTVTNVIARIGFQAGSTGTVTVAGAGSTWTSSDSLYVGGSETTAGGTGSLTINSGDVDVANTLKIWSGGTVSLGGGRLEAATVDHTGGGAFTFSGGELNVGAFNGNLVNNGGLVTIGNSPGVMQVNGDYTQNSGTLEIELGGAVTAGTDYDLIAVTGTAALDSTLDVSLFDSGSGAFEPQSGDSFEILTSGNLIGTFATETLPALRGGLSLDVVYDTGADTVTLAVLGTFGDVDLDGDVDTDDIDALAANAGSTNPLYDLDGDGFASTFAVSASGVSSDSDFLIRTILGTEYGDANLDGKIDIIDLDLLGQDFNDANATVGGWLFGDFDGSGLTDITDLDLLGQNYGFVAATAAAVPIPEPTTWCLVLMGVALLAMRRRVGRNEPGEFRHSHRQIHRQSVYETFRGGFRAMVTQCRNSATARSGLRVACHGAIVVVAVAALATDARADLVVTDALERATVTVTPTALPAPGFITYTFSVEPFLASQEVTSIDANFTSATTMRQVDPGGGSPTVFNDLNLLFPAVFEGISGEGDSQFHFSGLHPSLLVAVQTESPTSLSAAFTGFTPIQTTSTFGHVVLPVGDFGTFDFRIVVRDDGVLGAGDTATFSSVSFGGLTAVPEASTVLVWSLLTVGAGVSGVFRRPRRFRRTEMQHHTFENKEHE